MRKLSPEQKRRINPNQIKPEKSEGGKIECVLMEQKPFQIFPPLSSVPLLSNTGNIARTANAVPVTRAMPKRKPSFFQEVFSYC